MVVAKRCTNANADGAPPRRAAPLPPRRATPLPRGNIFPGRRAALYHIPRCFVPHLDGGGAWCPARSDEIELLQDLVSRSSFAFSFISLLCGSLNCLVPMEYRSCCVIGFAESSLVSCRAIGFAQTMHTYLSNY
jgi:hypothetical protein